MNFSLKEASLCSEVSRGTALGGLSLMSLEECLGCGYFFPLPARGRTMCNSSQKMQSARQSKEGENKTTSKESS